MSEGIPPQESYVQFPEIASEIDAMAKVDQDMREHADDGSWDDSVDLRNTERMREIVAQIGWPTISKIGEQSSSHAWLLVQHADRNVEFQEQCLALMKQEPAGEVARRNIAMLDDRIHVNRGIPQVYGTQFTQIKGKHVPRPIEDEEHVDERRKQMGMEPLEENIAKMYEKYGKPSEELDGDGVDKVQ